jgi:hypothetical protein
MRLLIILAKQSTFLIKIVVTLTSSVDWQHFSYSKTHALLLHSNVKVIAIEGISFKIMFGMV